MALSSATYFVFLAAIFFLYWPVARVRRLGLAVLLFANYFFYARWGIAYLFLIPAASTCDFLVGLGLQRFQNRFLRRSARHLEPCRQPRAAGFAQVSTRSGAASGFCRWRSRSMRSKPSLTPSTSTAATAKGTSSYLAHLAAVSFFPTTLAGPITRVSDLLAPIRQIAHARALGRRPRAVSDRPGPDQETADRGLPGR